jgi:hypothetical protein
MQLAGACHLERDFMRPDLIFSPTCTSVTVSFSLSGRVKIATRMALMGCVRNPSSRAAEALRAAGVQLTQGD